jgi:uncharacterized membrane protein YfcA
MSLVIAALVVTAVAAVGQSVTGFGYALLVVPVLTVVAGPKTAVATMTAIGVPLVLFNAVRWRGHLERRLALVLLGTALLGMPAGVLILRGADERLLAAIVGVVVVMLTIAIWRGLTVPPGPPTLVTAGLLSGVLSTSVGTNGPPLVVALHAEDIEPAAFRATLQAIFAIEGSIALATFWANGLVTANVLVATAIGVPTAIGGALLGDRIARHVDRARFRTLVLWNLVLSGVVALASAMLEPT